MLFNTHFEVLAPFEHHRVPLISLSRGELNAWVYERVNNGVYRAGFATTQEAYEEAVIALFDALDSLEERLAGNRYLLGDRLSEADLRLFTTLIRFDPVYVGHFKCNLRRLADYPNLWGYTRELAQIPGIAGTISMDHIKAHYFRSHPNLHPSGVVPLGPVLDIAAPHHRDQLGSADQRQWIAV